MRILILADIHSNWAALETIDESFDACLFAGDLVDYGSDPISCMNWLKKNATATVRGNHDHAVAQKIPSKGDHGFRRLAAATREWHWKTLSATHRKFLGRFPVTNFIEIDSIRFHMVHGTPKDPMDEYLGYDPNEWEKRVQSIETDFVLCGHTHKPYHLELENCQILNPGSVGQPRDGNPEGSYAIIVNGKVEMKRFKYDIDKSIDHMRSCEFFEPWVIELTEQVLRTGSSLSKEEMDQYV